MSVALCSVFVFACLSAALLLGMGVRRLLPEHHLGADTRDTVKLAMGLVATMTALVLGLLVSSIKGSYDNTRNQVIEMASKIAFLDRVLALYGPETAASRSRLHTAVEQAVQQMWPKGEGKSDRVALDTGAGDAFYFEIQRIAPLNDLQRGLKDEAASLAVDIGQLRTRLATQAIPSISEPMLVVVVAWLMLIFFSFSLFAPHNATANLSLFASTFSVAGAIFLILEMDGPFVGVIRISTEPMLNVLVHMAK